MYFSKYNIFSKIRDSENYFILNPLTGSADILESKEANEIINGNITGNEIYIERGYLIDEDDEKKLFNHKYLDFIDRRENDEIQIFYVPWYACNFGCDYCYQKNYEWNIPENSIEVINYFFQYVEKEFSAKNKYITIFGGEPLLKGEQYRNIIKKLIEETRNRNLDIAFVTNGYYLSEYINLLKLGNIREVQVTLDGTKDIHNKRRFLKNNEGTFEKIIEGIDDALANKININLRIVLDRDNINELPLLAQFAIEKGWTKNQHFKTQIGRNYELHDCYSKGNKLFPRAELYNEIYNLIKKHPNILEFHKPAFSISDFIFENNEMPDPLFDSCPGCKTEWAFDYKGNIYSCTATVGKQGEELGTFYPHITRKTEVIEEWQERDITLIQECKSCNLQLACGGGCASVSKNRTGKILSSDCRPIRELLEMGFSLYSKE